MNITGINGTLPPMYEGYEAMLEWCARTTTYEQYIEVSAIVNQSLIMGFFLGFAAAIAAYYCFVAFRKKN